MWPPQERIVNFESAVAARKCCSLSISGKMLQKSLALAEAMIPLVAELLPARQRGFYLTVWCCGRRGQLGNTEAPTFPGPDHMDLRADPPLAAIKDLKTLATATISVTDYSLI